MHETCMKHGAKQEHFKSCFSNVSSQELKSTPTCQDPGWGQEGVGIVGVMRTHAGL